MSCCEGARARLCWRAAGLCCCWAAWARRARSCCCCWARRAWSCCCCCWARRARSCCCCCWGKTDSVLLLLGKTSFILLLLLAAAEQDALHPVVAAAEPSEQDARDAALVSELHPAAAAAAEPSEHDARAAALGADLVRGVHAPRRRGRHGPPAHARVRVHVRWQCVGCQAITGPRSSYRYVERRLGGEQE